VNNWKETTLGEVAELAKDQWMVGDEDQKYIGLEHINQGDLQINGFGCSSSLQSNKFYFKEGDVLFGKLRPYFRKVWKASFDGVCSTDIWVIRAKEGYDQNFLFYFMANPVLIDKSTGASTGTKMPRADWDFLKGTEWSFPPLPEQKAIAAILSGFDDKIELLRRQNKTLESSAQTIFKEWFIKFKVKGEELKINSKTGLPEGWRMGKLGEILAVFDSKRIPLSGEERAKRKGKYPYYGATEIMDYIDDYIFDGIYVLLGEDGSVIDDRGYAVLQYVWGKIWVNNHAHVLQGKNGWSTETLYLLLKRMPVSGIITGAVQLKINQENLLNIGIVLPDKEVLEKFDSVIQPIFNKIRNNNSQIQTLSKLRDALLPKLMKGEIRVKP
jgi:type I restriction enzyme S subunit